MVNIMFNIITNNPVAIDSRDHTNPHGTKADNSVNQVFNNKLYELFRTNKCLKIMDIGCSGGGFVKNCIDDGHIAIGLEGSDYSRNHKRAEWVTIPDNLFTCDVTHPFEINDENGKVVFDIVTAWELMEHLPADRLSTVCNNIRRHLARDGIWIMSISPNKEYHHVTTESREWWLNLFTQEGFKNRDDYVKHFGNDWVRGPYQAAPNSFHFVFQKL